MVAGNEHRMVGFGRKVEDILVDKSGEAGCEENESDEDPACKTHVRGHTEESQ